MFMSPNVMRRSVAVMSRREDELDLIVASDHRNHQLNKNKTYNNETGSTAGNFVDIGFVIPRFKGSPVTQRVRNVAEILWPRAC